MKKSVVFVSVWSDTQILVRGQTRETEAGSASFPPLSADRGDGNMRQRGGGKRTTWDHVAVNCSVP